MFWVLLIVLSNVDFLDVIKEMFSSKYYKGYMIIGVALLFAVIAINAYGLVFGISDMTSKKGTKDAADTNNMWKNFIQSGYETKSKTVGFVL